MTTTNPIEQAKSTQQEYQEKVKIQLNKLSANIDELKAKSRQASAEASLQYNNLIEELSAKRDAAEAKLQEMQDTTGDAWVTLREGFERAWSDLSESFAEVSRKFQ